MDRNRGPGHRLMDAFFRLSKLHMLRPSEGPGLLRPAEVQTLHVLIKTSRVDGSGHKVSELSQLMHVTPSMVTQVVKTLEKRGFVARTLDEVDRRAVRLRITAEGRAALHQALAGMVASFDGLAEHLGQEKSEQLLGILTDVYEYVLNKRRTGVADLAPDSEEEQACATNEPVKAPIEEDDLQP